MTKPYRPLLLAAGAVTAFFALFALGGLLGWWTPAANEPPIGAVSRWCERVSDGLIREPLNTLGNLAFIITGLTMFGVLARDAVREVPQVNPFVGNQPLALLYAAAAVFLGPGSMVMHGSHTFFGAWFDNLSMVIYIVIPWLYNVSLLAGWSLRQFAAIYVAVIGVYGVGYWVAGPDLGIGIDLFEVSIPLWIISETLVRWPRSRWWSGLVGFAVAIAFGIMPWTILTNLDRYWWVILFWLPAVLMRMNPGVRRTYTPWFWLGMAAFLSAFAIWNTGKPDHPWCDPDGFVQAHAVWHVLSALATWCFFLFLRSQRSLAPTPHGMANAGHR